MARARLVETARGLDVVGQAVRRRQGPAADALPRLPEDAAGWTRACAEALRSAPRLSPEVARALADRQDALGAGPSARANALRLGDGANPALALVTGQQPGLLGGPLLTFHKAAGAIRLARSVSAWTGRPVVPVFWLASEDHDLEEANQATVLDAAGQPRRVALAVVGAGKSLADLDVSAESSARLEAELKDLLSPTPRATEALALFRRAGSESFATWSARCLLKVFGDQGLVLLEPRVLGAPLGGALGHLVRDGAKIQSAVRAAGERLSAAGLPAPLDPRPGDLPLFLRDAPGGARQRVALGEDGRVTADGQLLAGGTAALAERLTREPALGSPDVVGRVFVQNALLPVLAYVAGPTEIAYLAQVAAAHAAVGRRFPLAVPRPSAFWVDARVEDTARDFGCTLEALLTSAAPAGDRAYPAVDAYLAEVRGSLEAARAKAEALGPVGPQGSAAVKAALDRLLGSWDRSLPSVRAALDADAGLGAARWVRLQNLLFPRGRPQERVLSMLALLARYGLDAVRAGLADLDPLADGVWVVRGDGSPDA